MFIETDLTGLSGPIKQGKLLSGVRPKSSQIRTPQNIPIWEELPILKAQTVKETAQSRQRPPEKRQFDPLQPKESNRRENANNSLFCNKLWTKNRRFRLQFELKGYLVKGRWEASYPMNQPLFYSSSQNRGTQMWLKTREYCVSTIREDQ